MQQIISIEMKLISEITPSTFTSTSVVTLLKIKTVFRNLKVSHPRCVVKNKYVKKILFCTVTKHN